MTFVNQILQRLRQAKLICSDETSARVNGQNQWEWVFQNQDIRTYALTNLAKYEASAKITEFLWQV